MLSVHEDFEKDRNGNSKQRSGKKVRPGLQFRSRNLGDKPLRRSLRARFKFSSGNVIYILLVL